MGRFVFRAEQNVGSAPMGRLWMVGEAIGRNVTAGYWPGYGPTDAMTGAEREVEEAVLGVSDSPARPCISAVALVTAFGAATSWRVDAICDGSRCRASERPTQPPSCRYGPCAPCVLRGPWL